MKEASLLLLGALEGTKLSGAEKTFISSAQAAGVTLFSRNIENPNGLEHLELIRELQSLREGKSPFIVAVDQEGGKVARLKHPDIDLGSAYFLLQGRDDQEALAEIKLKASLQGRRLRSLGFNVNFAPVVDIGFPLDQHKDCFVGDRALGAKISQVTGRAFAFLSGLESEKVFGCLKHFPGIGRVKADTHIDKVYCHLDQGLSWEEILNPFISLREKASLVMVSHCIYPHIDSLEASRSEKIITGVLRKHIGFEGLVLCDDLTMGAVKLSDLEWKEYVVASVVAGCDLILVCRGLEPWQMANDALILETKKSPAFTKRVEKALSRLQRFRQKLFL